MVKTKVDIELEKYIRETLKPMFGDEPMHFATKGERYLVDDILLTPAEFNQEIFDLFYPRIDISGFETESLSSIKIQIGHKGLNGEPFYLHYGSKPSKHVRLNYYSNSVLVEKKFIRAMILILKTYKWVGWVNE